MIKFYYLDEFAKLTDIGSNTLKEWNKQGLFKPMSILQNGNWLYSEEQIKEAEGLKKIFTKDKPTENIKNDESIEYLITIVKMFLPKLTIDQKNICNNFIKELVMTSNIDTHIVEDIIYKEIETNKRYSAFEKGLIDLKMKCYALGLFNEWDKIEIGFRENKSVITEDVEYIRKLFPEKSYILDKIIYK